MQMKVQDPLRPTAFVNAKQTGRTSHQISPAPYMFASVAIFWNLPPRSAIIRKKFVASTSLGYSYIVVDSSCAH